MSCALEKLAMLEGEMDNLRMRVAQLEAELELERRKSAPYQPITTPPYQPTWVIPSSCAVCGIKFDGPMGYACNNPRCPSGVSYCSSKVE